MADTRGEYEMAHNNNRAQLSDGEDSIYLENEIIINPGGEIPQNISRYIRSYHESYLKLHNETCTRRYWVLGLNLVVLLFNILILIAFIINQSVLVENHSKFLMPNDFPDHSFNLSKLGMSKSVTSSEIDSISIDALPMIPGSKIANLTLGNDTQVMATNIVGVLNEISIPMINTNKLIGTNLLDILSLGVKGTPFKLSILKQIKTLTTNLNGIEFLTTTGNNENGLCFIHANGVTNKVSSLHFCYKHSNSKCDLIASSSITSITTVWFDGNQMKLKTSGFISEQSDFYVTCLMMTY